MHRKLVAVAAAIALVGAGMALGSLSTASSQTQARGPNEIIRAFAPDNRNIEENINAGRKDETLGDYFVGLTPLLNKPGGKKIGSEKHVCYDIAETEDSFSAICTATAWLEGRGKISVQGTLKVKFSNFQHGPPTAAFAVTGGTGEFRNARGVLTLTFRDKGLGFKFDLP